MFFTDGSGVAMERVKSIDKPMFRRFMQKIVERCHPDDAGMKFRRLRHINSDTRSPAAAPSSGVGCKRLRFYQMFPRRT